MQGARLMAALLADVLERVSRAEIAAFALVVDAKDKIASALYLHRGFIAFAGSPLSLFLPMAAVSVFKP